ncbi:MAG: AAA family ATPase [Candidatus Accumulibacter sp.]|nr:AAA family ATPase [Accumulibacter sp.]
MKIEQVDLKAYGHFSNQRLHLAGGANLHLICGPNEAGKTTLWRAINGALFGIPETTRDGYLHGNPKLRVGLVLSSRAGERLAVMRRKGRVNTLLAYDPETASELSATVPDERLGDWLGGLGQGLFLAMFSLDHAALVRGGEALAQGRGDAGESLFEAGAGLGSIRALRTRLESEAESLFKPRASKSAIYRALAEHEESRRQAREATVRPLEWTAARSAMEAASKEYEAARAEQLRLHTEARRLERLAAILPDVAALGLARQQLGELAAVPLLPPSAASERVAAVTQRAEALAAERAAASRLQQHQSGLAAIRINDGVLADAEAIEAIHHATAACREAALQSARAAAVIAAARGKLDLVSRQIAGDAEPADALQWIPDATRTARIRALITEGATLKARHQADLANRQAKTLEVAQLEAALRELQQTPASDDLGNYLDSIADQGDPEARAQQLDDEAAAAAARLEAEARGLRLPAAAVARTTVPLDAELQAFRLQDEELRRRERSIREAIEKLEDDLAALRGDIKGLEIGGSVPTREALAALRSARDGLWLALRRHFLPAADASVAPDPPPPAGAYELAVSRADEAADELFADAERATRYAGFRVRESQMESALDLDRQRAATLASDAHELARRWAAVLAANGLPDLTIGEAAAWLARREAWQQKFAAREAQRHEAERLRRVAQDVRSRLAELCGRPETAAQAAGERLSESLARARTINRRHAEQRTQRQLKSSSLANAVAVLQHARAAASDSGAAVADWTTRWAAAMASIRLAADASEAEATARLQQLADLVDARDTLDRSNKEHDDARIQIDDFQTRLATTWQRVRGEALPVDDRSPDLLAAELYRELNLTRSLQEKRNTLSQQIADDQQAIDEARLTAGGAATVIERLQRQAACDTIEDLELVEGLSAQRGALTAEVLGIEARLVRAAGLPLPEVLRQAAGQEPDAIAEGLARNAQESERNVADVQRSHERYLAARQHFATMDGSAVAADAQQRMAQHAARLAELAADYAAARIAAAVLAQVIDAYQKRNQAPLVDKASRHFAALTGNRYRGVVVDYDDERQILKAVRADGERLHMEQLSTGRRDQLFLALRLAAIEGHLDNGEPLPVIVDDITVHFDDAAAAATFRVLAELSQRTQVLFLTHHEHLLDVASAAVGNDAYRSHQLSG